MMAYLNGNHVPNLLRFSTLVTKFVGTICAVSAGLPMGPEGPMVHIGACLASVITYMECSEFLVRPCKALTCMLGVRPPLHPVASGQSAWTAGSSASLRIALGGSESLISKRSLRFLTKSLVIQIIVSSCQLACLRVSQRLSVPPSVVFSSLWRRPAASGHERQPGAASLLLPCRRLPYNCSIAGKFVSSPPSAILRGRRQLWALRSLK